MIGQRFGKLVIMSISKQVSGARKKKMAECLCDCGKEKTIVIENLKSGTTKSCGCKRNSERISVVDRFWSRVEKQKDGCWIFKGSLTAAVGGYGQVCDKGKTILAHIFSYRLNKGEIGNLQVLHICDVRQCVNPDHLFLGTQEDNMNDCKTKGRNSKGSNHGRAKLNEEQVKFIWLNKGKYTYDFLSKRFNVSIHTIQSIADGRNWGWYTSNK